MSVGGRLAKGRLKHLLSAFALSANGHSDFLAVVPIEIHTEESAVPIVRPEKKQNRGDIFTELTVRLGIHEDHLRRTLVSRSAIVALLAQTQSRGRPPEPGELDGSDPDNFVETLHLPLATANTVATTDPLQPLTPAPPWTGDRVTIRDLIPRRSDRQRIAKMQRSLLANGVRA